MSSDAYIYGIFPVDKQAIGVFRFFAYKQISSQVSNKEQVKEQKQHIKPQNEAVCFRFNKMIV